MKKILATLLIGLSLLVPTVSAEEIPQPGDYNFVGPLEMPQPGDCEFVGPLSYEVPQPGDCNFVGPLPADFNK